jgi:hypothetical protein
MNRINRIESTMVASKKTQRDKGHYLFVPTSTLFFETALRTSKYYLQYQDQLALHEYNNGIMSYT